MNWKYLLEMNRDVAKEYLAVYVDNQRSDIYLSTLLSQEGSFFGFVNSIPFLHTHDQRFWYGLRESEAKDIPFPSDYIMYQKLRL
jgi:hypothetical protein